MGSFANDRYDMMLYDCGVGYIYTGQQQTQSACDVTSSTAESSVSQEEEEGMTDELKSMRLELQEKERVIVELRNTNSSLKHTPSVYGDLHSLENQVQYRKQYIRRHVCTCVHTVVIVLNYRKKIFIRI